MPVSDEQSAFTIDAFHRGKFWLVQPGDGGHRAGMDAMILAASVPSGFSGRLADLGAGAGAAGFAVASRCPAASVVLVENAPVMLGYAERSIAHPDNSHLRGRIALVAADVELAGKARAESGLADRSFDFAIMNPPFNAGHDRATPKPLKRDAHVMPDGMFEAWVRSAAAIVRPHGGVAVIARPQSIGAILAAFAGRFGKVEILPVQPRPEAAAIRIVVRAVRASRAGLRLLPPLPLHHAGSDRVTERTESITNGGAALFGD